MVVQGTRAVFLVRAMPFAPWDVKRAADCPTIVLRVAACPTVVLRVAACPTVGLRFSYGTSWRRILFTCGDPVADMACARSGPRGFCAAMYG